MGQAPSAAGAQEGALDTVKPELLQARAGRSLLCWLPFPGTVAFMEVAIFCVNAGECGGKGTSNLSVPV